MELVNAPEKSASDAQLIRPLICEHFHPATLANLTITGRQFPFRVRVDLQRAIDDILSSGLQISFFSGVFRQESYETTAFADLLSQDPQYPARVSPPYFEQIDVGEPEPRRCLRNGLWLLNVDGVKLALLMCAAQGFGQKTGVDVQIAAVKDEAAQRLIQSLYEQISQTVYRAPSYRGKVLSLEPPHPFNGRSNNLIVHKLHTVERDQVILPRKTLDLLDRNVIDFVRQRPSLSKFGLATKKGLLFYGPPGTGKTHTIHYLAAALPGHTTLLITGGQVGLISEYMTLARLLQPSIVVIEDVDLIARDRERMNSPCEEATLNVLLNEMDGLTETADILFILTTNRPQSLEQALASRPGRIDQAIEFPLPDEQGREKLVRLYSRGLDVPDDVVRVIVSKTQNVSAAFIKELMRRSAQFHLQRQDSPRIEIADVDAALDELLFSGGTLNRQLLGAAVEDPST